MAKVLCHAARCHVTKQHVIIKPARTVKPILHLCLFLQTCKNSILSQGWGKNTRLSLLLGMYFW